MSSSESKTKEIREKNIERYLEEKSNSDQNSEGEELDDFLIKASSILNQEKHPEKRTIIESLKCHLETIFHGQSEMKNFFKTLNNIIFTPSKKKHSKKKILNLKSFILFPVVFSFNPKSSFYYIDYYLTSLQSCLSEITNKDFPFLSKIFSEVIVVFFDEKKTIIKI